MYSGVSCQLKATTVETISISVRNNLTARMFESKAALCGQHFTHQANIPIIQAVCLRWSVPNISVLKT
jgi:hypothetical protein